EAHEAARTRRDSPGGLPGGAASRQEKLESEPVMLQIIYKLAWLFAWLAIPVGLLVIVDDWFLRPRPLIAAAPQPPADPPLIRIAHLLLPLLVAAVVLRLLMAERLDFSAVLFAITALTGLVWLLDVVWLRRRRAWAARAAGKDPAQIPEPGTVDY